MILVDTSVWVDHLRANDEGLADLLMAEQVLAHPFVIGELALGNLSSRDSVLDSLAKLPQAAVADHEETLTLIARHRLSGSGIGYVDAALLASVKLTPGCLLWTRDKRLGEAAGRLKIGAGMVHEGAAPPAAAPAGKHKRKP